MSSSLFTGADAVMDGRVLMVVSVLVWLGPDPAGCNGAVENVLSVDGGAACSGRKECGDRGHVC